MPDPNGQSLMTRWSMLERLQGDEANATWTWFIERYRPFVCACLTRVAGRSGEVEAAEAEIWSYLYTSEVFERADRSRRFRSFLAGVIRNFGRDWRRRNHHQQGDDDSEQELEAEAKLDLPEDEEMRLFARQVLQLALSELERKHPDNAIALRCFYGIPVDADGDFVEAIPASGIAKRLGIATNAVHQILHRGRKRLREHIERELRETVALGSELDEELALMLEAMGRDAPGLTG